METITIGEGEAVIGCSKQEDGSACIRIWRTKHGLATGTEMSDDPETPPDVEISVSTASGVGFLRRIIQCAENILTERDLKLDVRIAP